jgi:hypothetical protein
MFYNGHIYVAILCHFTEEKELNNCIYQLSLSKVLLILMSLCDLNRERNPLKLELNPICYLLALLGAHHLLHVSRVRVKLLTLRRLMSYIYIYIYIYGAPILDVSRSHTTTQNRR